MYESILPPNSMNIVTRLPNGSYAFYIPSYKYPYSHKSFVRALIALFLWIFTATATLFFDWSLAPVSCCITVIMSIFFIYEACRDILAFYSWRASDCDDIVIGAGHAKYLERKVFQQDTSGDEDAHISHPE